MVILSFSPHLFDHGDLLLPDHMSDSLGLGHIVLLLPGWEDISGCLLLCDDGGWDCPDGETRV